MSAALDRDAGPAAPRRGATWFLLAGNRVFLQLGAVTTLLVGLAILCDVVGRAFFNRPLEGAIEIAQNGVVLAVFFCFPHAVQQDDVLRIGGYYEGASARLRQAIHVCGLLLGLVFMVGMIVTNIPAAVHALRTSEVDGFGAIRVPMGMMRVLVIVLWSWAALNMLQLLAREFAGSGDGEP